ncbi:MAG: hypothetical protein FJ125_17185 [Deltaproteobacteria bacterium]|nr:hypothetical protein [Deltaproteobacteria bacterium]
MSPLKNSPQGAWPVRGKIEQPGEKAVTAPGEMANPLAQVKSGVAVMGPIDGGKSSGTLSWPPTTTDLRPAAAQGQPSLPGQSGSATPM